MTEPISTSAQEAKAETTSASATEGLPAEDRAAAVALSSLNTTTAAATEDADAQSGTALPSRADQEALGKAMSRLEALATAAEKGGSGPGAGTGVGKKDAGGAGAKEEEKVVKKSVVKVKAEDVNLLIDQLDLTKLKATELLKAHDGDLVKAMRAFIMPRTVAA
ncbi:hypothetical protein PRK78_004992 [Emydomyces testavorans]|uniref:Nascent polypeptide-associated complex subunit alpha-like UBA domain-containing protein n=1 Tax=Emydomyces testavorans TaxID=2070801 RepID=A0AAF0IJN0_9EURO|nr:hypothetical protein PRK78_004992 [Emydomyces testavorans]